MRIERLDLAAFGRFTGHALDFGAGKPDFHLLYGANEAGKSTTLAAIADLLYGIEERSAFNFLHDYRNMLLAATVSDSAGARLSFRRRKGRSNTLLDQAGAPTDESRLAAMRGSEDRSFFTGMFGLDHARLREGGEHILSAQGDLGQSLFQAGAAVRDLHALLKQLDGDAGALFKPGGQNPSINRALAAIKDAHARVRQGALKGDAWKQLEEKIAGVQARLAEITTERDGLTARRSQLERIRRVLPHLAHCDRLERELADLAGVPVLPASAPVQRREAEEALATFGHAAEQAETKFGQLREQRKSLSVDAAMLAVLTAIGRLQKQHGAVAKAIEDLPVRRGERRQVETRIATALRHLGRDLPPAEAHRILPTRPDVAAIRALITEEAELAANGRLMTKAAEEAEELVKRLEADLALMPTALDSRPLVESLREITRHGRPDNLLMEAEVTLSGHQQAIDTTMAALPGWSGDADALARLPVPTPEAVSEAEERLAAAARRAEAAAKAVKETRDEDALAEAELAALSDAGPVATEVAVAEARRRRDAGWRLVRHRFVEGLVVDDSDFAAGLPLPDAFEQSVADADSLADRVAGEAQRAAQLAAAIKRKALAERRWSEAEKEAAAASAARAGVEEEWLALWRACGLDPARPRAMLGFLAGRKEILARIEQAAGTRQAVARFKAQRDEGGRKLADTLAVLGEDGTGLDFPALVARAETVIQSLEQSNAQRRALETHLERARGEVAPVTARSEEAGRAQAAWRLRWGQALAPLGLDAHAGTVEVQAVLDVLDDLAALAPELDGLTHRIDAMEADVAKFCHEVEALAAAVAADLSGKPALDVLAELAERAQAARDADRAARDLDHLTTEAEDEHQAAEGKRHAAQEVLARLCRQAGCERPEELAEAEYRSARRQAAEAELAEQERALLDAGDGLGLAELAAEATSVDRDRLAAEVDNVLGRLAVLEQEADGLKAEQAQHRVAQDAMDGTSAASSATEDVEQLSAGLRDDAARYIRLRLGHALLRQSVERFRRRHQGPLLERAADLFRRLTLGAFAGLDAGFDDHDQPILLAVREAGDRLEVKGLSEGTRDQLFLALRLAAVDLHLAAGRRLPFIADDLLIHFDDDRAAAALAVLADLATRTQVLFFTHNRHLVDLAKAHLSTEAYRAMEV